MIQTELDFEGASWTLLWEFDLGDNHFAVFQDEWERLNLVTTPRVRKKRTKSLLTPP